MFPQEQMHELFQQWLRLWNGDLSLASGIVADDYRLNMVPMDGSDLSHYAGPSGLAGWIGQMHRAFSPLKFEVQVGPLFSSDMIAVRWVANGTYAGGMPGAKALPGTRVSFAGADFLRIQQGKIAEYWVSSDMLSLMAQLGMMGG